MGGASAFFGGKLLDWVVAVLAAVLAFHLVALMTSNYFAPGGNFFIALIFFFFSLGAGLYVGRYVKKSPIISLGLIGSCCGVFCAFLLYTLVLGKLSTRSTWLLWLSLYGGAILGSKLAFRFSIIVPLTAVVGAYSLTRGISLFIGGFPSEFEMIGQIKAGTFQL